METGGSGPAGVSVVISAVQQLSAEEQGSVTPQVHEEEGPSVQALPKTLRIAIISIAKQQGHMGSANVS